MGQWKEWQNRDLAVQRTQQDFFKADRAESQYNVPELGMQQKYSKNNKDSVTEAYRVLLESMIPPEVRVGEEGLHRNLKAMVTKPE